MTAKNMHYTWSTKNHNPVKILLLIIFMCGLGISLHAQEDEPYVMESSGNKITGTAIEADNDGTIKLAIGDGVTQNFNLNDYDYAYTPKPKEVKALERALQNEKYDVILDNSSDVFKKYKYLGWAGVIGYIEAEAYLAEDKPRQALQSVNFAENFAHFNKMQLRHAKVKALLAVDELDKAKEVLKKLKTAESAKIAAFAYNTQGDILQKQGDKHAAVLEYLKPVLVIKSEQARQQIEEARQKLVSLLKDMGDDRYKQFQKK